MAEATPVPAPGMVLQGLKWMLKADSPLFVRPSLSPPFVRFMVTMARHCNEGDFRRSLQVHLEMASTCGEVLDEWADDGLSLGTESHCADRRRRRVWIVAVVGRRSAAVLRPQQGAVR